MRPRHARVRPQFDLARLKNVRPRDLALRFAFGAAISLGAALIAAATGARFGGVFLAFPAILPASLTLLQDEEGTRDADRNAIGAVLGGVALVVFAIVGEAGFGRIPAGAALLAALGAWLLTAVGLYGALATLRPDACDMDQD